MIASVNPNMFDKTWQETAYSIDMISASSGSHCTKLTTVMPIFRVRRFTPPFLFT